MAVEIHKIPFTASLCWWKFLLPAPCLLERKQLKHIKACSSINNYSAVFLGRWSGGKGSICWSLFVSQQTQVGGTWQKIEWIDLTKTKLSSSSILPRLSSHPDHIKEFLYSLLFEICMKQSSLVSAFYYLTL